MCGITGIVLKEKNGFNLSEKIVSMTDTISHRGPDGEGFMSAGQNETTPHYHTLKQHYQRTDLNYIPKSSVHTCNESSFLAFGHRRLAIIDLSESGHQPMSSSDSNLWIVFNGEIYNYIELKKELLNAGHIFVGESDTEVILAAYRQWGTACVERFNGMWAFCIYDTDKNICFASRDRLGVKPFYYLNNKQFFAFASEQKAFVKSGLLPAVINKNALHSYLVNDLLENSTDNFFDGLSELWPGKNLVYTINSGEIQTYSYYHLSDHITSENDHLSEKQLIEKIIHALEESVRLRLRSDVEIGSCLSGGIDSSALASIITRQTQKPLFCFTAIFKDQVFNEERFADIVAGSIQAKHFKTQPSFDGFLSEVDELVYSQDVPIWSTSTYAQHKVMALAKEHKIKVVLDGQGADELFGGYHHHFLAGWNNLIGSGKLLGAIREISASGKTFGNPFAFYLKERLKQKKNFREKHLSLILQSDFITHSEIKNPTGYYNDINKQLLNDIYETRLKSFLKCEDRCGMWHSVESRTPFADDIELINLMFSFNGNKKIKNGISKHLLREAVKDKIPHEIYSRYDKRGFETPMQEWMKKLRPQLLSEIKNSGFDFVNYKNLEKTNAENTTQNNLLFKLFILGRWQKLFSA